MASTYDDIESCLRDAIHRKIDEIDPVTMLRYSYVPFCVAEGCWDYADSLVSLAILQRQPETKRISRAIRELRRSYEKKRSRSHNSEFTHEECQEGELDNYLSVENVDKELFRNMRKSICDDITNQYPDLHPDHAYFISGVYQCRAVLKALFQYSRQQTEIIRQHLGLPFMVDILPRELYALYDVVIEFAGDKRIHPSKIDHFADELAHRLATTEFTDIPNNLKNNQQ